MLNITHSYSDDAATIRIDGLSGTVRMLHLTDSHVLEFDERDGDHLDACREFRERFLANRREESGQAQDPALVFQETLQEAANMDLDLIALTGDIVHYPSPAAIEFVASRLAELQAPSIYTFGNHDVHYTDEPANRDRRDHWVPKLEPLHHGSPDFEAREIGGIRFIALDSYDCQILPEQLEFFKRQLADDAPIVLLTHVPISVPTLRGPTIEAHGAPIFIGDPDWGEASRTQWQIATVDAPETLEFVRLVAHSPNVVACFCGHIHFPHVDGLGLRAAQYVGEPCFQGGRRIVEFKPF
jgi:DNA repair exonuclease SbcCD nuclease subunit